MGDLYGQIDLTALGNIARNHPEAIKNVNFKDGSVHQMLNISVASRQQADQYGRTHYIKAGIKKADQKDGVKYYVADLKPSGEQQAAPAAPQQEPQPGGDDPLPF